MRTLFGISLLLAALSACSPSFQADLQDIEVTQLGVQVVGVPAAGVGLVSMTHSFTLSSDRLGWAKKINADVEIHQVKITATGLPDMGFLHLARMTASAPSSAQVVEIMSYERNPLDPASNTIQAGAPDPVDITELWRADQTVIELQIAGTLPTQDWSLDVTLNLSGRIAYSM